MRSRCKSVVIFLLVLVLCSCQTGLADGYVLPSSVTQLESEAFSGNTELTTITLKSGLTSIESNCFYGCSNLYAITIPKTVSSIGTDCFTGCPGDFVIRTTAGSYAMEWARDHHVDFQADTHYRALVIGQTYDDMDEETQLRGPLEDMQMMEQCLTRSSKTPYSVNVRHDLTASQILSEIDACFGAAQDQDVSLFYYSGHGIYSPGESSHGALYGADAHIVTASELRQKLDQIRGRKIIILDSCHSGALITVESGTMARAVNNGQNAASGFVNAFISAFSAQSRSADDYSRYYIITAAAEDEKSYEYIFQDENGERSSGLFTSTFVKGLGYDWWTGNYESLNADSNKNGAVSFREAYEYVKKETADGRQNCQVFPSDCNWMGIIRLQ